MQVYVLLKYEADLGQSILGMYEEESDALLRLGTLYSTSTDNGELYTVQTHEILKLMGALH